MMLTIDEVLLILISALSRALLVFVFAILSDCKPLLYREGSGASRERFTQSIVGFSTDMR